MKRLQEEMTEIAEATRSALDDEYCVIELQTFAYSSGKTDTRWRVSIGEMRSREFKTFNEVKPYLEGIKEGYSYARTKDTSE